MTSVYCQIPWDPRLWIHLWPIQVKCNSDCSKLILSPICEDFCTIKTAFTWSHELPTGCMRLLGAVQWWFLLSFAGASKHVSNGISRSDEPNFCFVRTLTGHAAAVSGVAFQPGSGKVLLSCSADKTVKVWSEDGEELRTLSVSSPLEEWKAQLGCKLCRCIGFLIQHQKPADITGYPSDIDFEIVVKSFLGFFCLWQCRLWKLWRKGRLYWTLGQFTVCRWMKSWRALHFC